MSSDIKDTHTGRPPWTGWAASAGCPVSHRTVAGSPSWSS